MSNGSHSPIRTIIGIRKKLATLIGAFETGIELVYSDMRIVGDDGREISPTYWQQRKNYYEELQLMLLANTVTGAASMFPTAVAGFYLAVPDPDW